MPRKKAAKPPAKGLLARLTEWIDREGPITIADFMQLCIGDSEFGYYASQQAFGLEGDFITAPEISQIFGELLGLWAVAVWQSMGEPANITVAELGPGRGTLMADALRAFASMPNFAGRLSLALIETSPALRKLQARSLCSRGVAVEWFESLEAIPPGPLIVLTNEFLDALPIRQLVWRGGSWRERSVGLDANSKLAFTELPSDARGEELAVAMAPEAHEGAVLELRPAAREIVAALAARATTAPMAALFIDYGHEQSGLGETLQAVRQHRYAELLSDPGEADLSAQVDFADLKRWAEAYGLNAYGPMPQGAFLLKLGLEVRRDRLLQVARPEQQPAIISGAARLVDPAQMGLLYKAMAFTDGTLPPPPPFSAEL